MELADLGSGAGDLCAEGARRRGRHLLFKVSQPLVGSPAEQEALGANSKRLWLEIKGVLYEVI